MDNTQVTPFFNAKNHKSYEELSVAQAMSRLNSVKFDEYNGHGRIINNNNYEATMPDKVITPKGAMQGGTKELSNNIKTVPTFFEPQVEKVELSDDTKATFARIGARARREFIEEQTARAYQYNIPYDVHNVNFLELSQKIDEYEELLKKAKDYCIDWDTSEYDPVYLRQEIEEQERKVLYENDDLYAYFVHSRGLEA
ncbi:unnamed protein product [Rotaria magnacalcarata]|uniref:Uncharacterized protein n=1 Tax=Rotaria magnacalcarata TaxID=392030 RepID=A0A816X6E9_9BILA|nr:unnamed protein product [Rotaria magnacalcarata]